MNSHSFENKFTDKLTNIYIYIYRIWHQITLKGWYAIKPKKKKKKQTKQVMLFCLFFRCVVLVYHGNTNANIDPWWGGTFFHAIQTS